jgi:alpha-N-arabinofuranosidase
MRLIFYKTLIFTVILLTLKPGINAQVTYQPVVPQTVSPAGTPYLSWEDQTQYTRTYHVNQNNPQASDKNDGSEEHPFLTINHAAQIVKPGERVLIHAGIYRELVRPLFSGEAENKMIAYEAVPGDQVIIRGSRVIKSLWKLSVDPHDAENQKSGLAGTGQSGSSGNIYSKQLWMTTLSDSLFDDGYFAFRLANCTNEEIDLMEWALRWKGRVPYSLPRGLIFQDGKRLEQLASYEDLLRLDGSYWVASDGKTIHINPLGEGNPGGHLFEAAVQPHIIQPQSTGLGYIRISGLILEHCANGFSRIGVGALFTMGGHHWIIEDNIVRHINSMGIEMGFDVFEYRDPRYTKRTDSNLGYNIVRRNIVSDCGTAGIRGHRVTRALVENNYIFDCGWQDAEFHWEVAGIKLLITLETLVRNNIIAHMRGGCGIWLDWDNRNSRVSGNILYDIKTVQGAIFIEASRVANLVDNNILWNISGQGVRVADTDNTIIAHNLFGNVSEELVVAKVATDRSLDNGKLTSKGNWFVNNIIVNQGKPILSDDPSNTIDFNVYVSDKSGQASMKDRGEHSVSIQGEMKLDIDNWLLSWKPASSLPSAPLVKSCDLDFFKRVRIQNRNFPGPFLGMENQVTLKLNNGL